METGSYATLKQTPNGNYECRPECGACCIALSISSPIPGMPAGKPAGVRCINLTTDLKCTVWGTPEYPKVCAEFRPGPDVCGNDREEAMKLLEWLEIATAPN